MNYKSLVVIVLILNLVGLVFNIKNEIPKSLECTLKNGLQIISRGKNNFYTQGIFFDYDGNLIESGGLYGESVLVKRDTKNKFNVIKQQNLDKRFFGEGVAKCGGFIYQLTWQEGTILKYKETDNGFNLIEELHLDSRVQEGWGLTYYKNNKLFATDGSSKIHVLNCNNDKINYEYAFEVKQNGRPLTRLNELAYNKNKDIILANVYYDENIYEINPNTGKVLNLYNMSDLKVNESNYETKWRQGYVLNGITPIPNEDDLYLVTGKKWDNYYVIKFPREKEPTY
jgi:glutamine cyclotransferase